MLPMVHRRGRADYEATWRSMQAFNRSRTAVSQDEIWLVEHPPVFTLGLAGKPEHLLHPGAIPVIRTDRGGQVTYHGPGQLVCYLLLDLRRLGLGARELVRRIESAMIDLLQEYRIPAHVKPGMPGVYVAQPAGIAKIGAVGLRIARHASYHGLALNVDMDLEPYARINPCGHAGLIVAQMKDYGVSDSMDRIADKLVAQLIRRLY